MKKPSLNILIKIVSTVLTIVTFIFAFFYGRDLVSQVEVFNISAWRVGLAVILFLCFYGLMSVHWFMITKSIDKNQTKKQILAFFASQPYKYLPSSLFTFSFRASYAKKLGLSIKRSSAAQLVENFNILGTGMVVGILFFLLERYTIFGIMGSVFSVTTIAIFFFIKYKVPIPKTEKTVNLKTEAKLISICFAAWIFSALSFYVLTYEQASFFNAASANSFSFVSGILAFFAPGGIGIRELVLSSFSISVSSIIVWRIFTLIMDIIVGLVAIFRINTAKN